MNLKLYITVCFSWLLWLTADAFASTSSVDIDTSLHIAVAANFASTVEQLKAEFYDRHKVNLIVSRGSTGKLYAQIINGAPFDIFLAADTDKPSELVKQGLAAEDSQMIYAIGKLVLWVPDRSISSCGDEVIKSGNLKNLAIPNPKLAPYGLAAEQVLKHFNALDKFKNKIIIGENVSQTFNFAATKNVEGCLVSYAQVLQAKQGSQDDSIWLVPSTYYKPIQQQAVILKRSQHQLAAKKFYDFIQSSFARQIIFDAGYELPT